MTLDTGNFFENREEQIKDLAPHTCLIQAKTYFGGAKWPAFDEIDIDYPAIGKLMRENNYRGTYHWNLKEMKMQILQFLKA